MYLTGHSLGGRLVQDVMYSIHYNNDVNILKQAVKEPKAAATFNGLGYNNLQYAAINLVLGDYKDKIHNYYYQYDLVGHNLGNDLFFERVGIDYMLQMRDENGEVIPKIKYYEKLDRVHGILNFLKDTEFIYPNVPIRG